MPLNSSQKAKITQNLDKLSCDLDPTYLTDIFQENFVFNTHDVDRINAYNPNTQLNRNKAFFDLLFQCKPEAYDVFVLALKTKGYKHLADILEKTDAQTEDVGEYGVTKVNKGRQCKEEEEMEERRMSAMEEAAVSRARVSTKSRNYGSVNNFGGQVKIGSFINYGGTGNSSTNGTVPGYDPQTGPQQTHREPSPSNQQAQQVLPEYSMTRKPRAVSRARVSTKSRNYGSDNSVNNFGGEVKIGSFTNSGGTGNSSTNGTVPGYDPQTGPQQTHREPSPSNQQTQQVLPEYSMTRKPRDPQTGPQQTHREPSPSNQQTQQKPEYSMTRKPRDPQTGPQQTHREPSPSNQQAQQVLPEYSMTRKPRDRTSSLSSSMHHETDSSEVKNYLQEQICHNKKSSEKELEELKVEMEEAGNDMEQEAAAGVPVEYGHYSFQGQSNELHNLLSPKQKESLLNLVRERNIEGIKDLFTSDKTISESEFKEALEWSIQQEDMPIVTLILDDICRLIQASEEDEVVDVWPGYRVDSPWKPIFVLLTRTKYFGKFDTFMGYPLYKRRYDFVSFEAAKVISSELVLKNLLSFEDMSTVRNAVASASLHKVHSNITIINGCPCRSRNDGDEIQQEMCVVVHCRVKGIIPFAEKPFPRKLSGIPVDVREAYFVLGMMDPRTVSPLERSLTDYTKGAASSSGGQDGDVSHKKLSGCSASSSSEDVTMEDVEHTGPEGDAEMSVYEENASIISRRSDITLEQGSKSTEFNPSLLIGSGIGPAGLDCRGSIGGFIPLKDGGIGAITCAHLFIQSRVGHLVTQPADGDLPPAKHSTQSVFGELVKMVFKEGSMDSTGVDAALIKITSRVPQSGEFVWTRREQITFAGFEPSSPPNFQEGKILKIQDLSGNDRHTALLKVGSETGLTKGVLYLYGTLVRLTDKDLTLPNGNTVTFYNNIEVSSIRNVTHFFDLGDSGSLVFMPLNGSDLHCIGLAVGFTSYHTCIVTPIESVFNELELPLKFINFLEHSNTN